MGSPSEQAVSVQDAGDGVALTDPSGAEVPVPELDRPEELALRGPDGVPIGTWGESENGDWWGSAEGDVQTFDSKEDAVRWVRVRLGMTEA